MDVTRRQRGEASAAEESSIPEVFTRTQLSAFSHISVPTYARWAMEGKGPKFRRAGGRVIYLRTDVLAWLDSLDSGGGQ